MFWSFFGTMRSDLAEVAAEVFDEISDAMCKMLLVKVQRSRQHHAV
jgi:hypothetical protein